MNTVSYVSTHVKRNIVLMLTIYGRSKYRSSLSGMANYLEKNTFTSIPVTDWTIKGWLGSFVPW